jgi:hypothetical protein
MRQDRRPHQQGVVCKTAAREQAWAEVLRLPRFAPELSCCLQDPTRRGQRAKPVRRNALGPKLRCCLQDCRASASGREPAGADSCAQPRLDSSADTASSNRDGGSAIFGDCPGRPLRTRGRRRFWRGDNRCADGAGSRLHHRLPGGVGTSKAGKPAGSRGNAVHPYERRCLIPAYTAAAPGLFLETAVE